MLKKLAEWNEANAKHLLSRTMFGFKREDVDSALSYSLDEFVDNVLFGDEELPEPPGSWVNSNPNWDDDFEIIYERFLQLVVWQYKLMQNQPTTFREKTVQFLSNNFVSEAEKVYMPQFIYIQNDMFRKNVFGNFKSLTKKVSIDPAMLIYLDGLYSTVEEPNENYARELMELFTIGIGNYTEEDIHNAARAFTGWDIKGLVPIRYDWAYDDGIKNFMGQEGRFDYADIIDIIFQQEETAKFIVRKLYKEFVYYVPDETHVTELANIFRDSDYELKPLFSALFKSEFFYSDEIKAAKIRTPNDFMISIFKQLNIPDSAIDYEFIIWFSEMMQQTAFDPPDVRGWEGQRKWISTSTLPIRNNFSDSIITGEDVWGDPLSFGADVISFARSFESSEDAVQFVEDSLNYLVRFPLSQEKKDRLLQTLLDGAAVYDWSTYNNQAEGRLQKYLKAVMRLAEYQLI
ncbi:MAG: DUF1800 domain-containing protein [Chlorobi bacterium]|nr:DUF1800 domain-containing protein [Chlorobiota bacterium]